MKRVLIVLLLMLAGYGGYLVGQVRPLDYSQELNQRAYKDIQDQNLQLVFYKRTCPYCQVAKKVVLKSTQVSPYTTFFVDVETDEGQGLVRLFQVKKAATIVRIRKGKVTLFHYARKTAEGQIIPNQEVIEATFAEGERP
ncbi:MULTISPECIES: thioredoxin [unclassified Streptococcus]|uniref:thioredoxin n=1 Tax=unclassified Streptococcus TaxID=2608887 RepID=UPI00211AC8B1|nr:MULTISPECIES: thioredoxin [unclassified Streptococcus]MCQ9212383.1 thioredoxin [Streptococcus sp. B01]MCQ9213722.1 thioredoxin [Streptococcus sp. O1]MCQ9214516.1 thioredoxin [Streptococcus sp. O1]